MRIKLSRNSGRILTCLLGAGVLTIGLAVPAAAHVTVQPEEAMQGDYAKLTFRVPNESDTAGTVKLQVNLPAETPFAHVQTKPHPGWTVETETTTFDKPVRSGDVDIEEAVTQVTWTAERGVRIGPGEFEEFEISAGPLPEADSLAFPAVQTYDDKSVVRWDQVVPEGEAEPEHPAPMLSLVATDEDGSEEATQAGAEDTSAPAETGTEAADGATVDSTARTLGAAGLGVGVLSLIVLGLVAMSLRRKGTGTTQ